MTAILHTDNLSIGYLVNKTRLVIADRLNLTLQAGQLVCLLGPNGAGKSTLIRTLAGMQKPLAGGVYLEQADIHQLPTRTLAKRLSVVLTEKIESALLTAYEVVSLGRYPYTNWSGTLTNTDHTVIADAFRLAGATDLTNRTMNELSDGERQRVMMARALAQEPQLMILDEITAFLDLPRRVEIMQLLRRMAHTTNRAILLSTHDLDLALRTADLIWLLPKGGMFVAGSPEDLVLDGSFERAFAGEGVAFDRQSGSFQLEQGLKQPVRLLGEGEAYIWTKRGLERSGYAVATDSNVLVTIHTNHNQPVWQIRIGAHTTTCQSVQELITYLRTTAQG